MSGRSRLSIPHELHQIKARQIYEQRIAKGKNGSSQGDWETARRYLTRYPKVIKTWKRQQAIAFYQQLPRLFFRRLARSFKALINGIWKIITFPFWLFYKLPQLFANTDTRPFALDVVQTVISAASLIAAVIAAIGLFVNYQDTLKDRELTQERLVTDRFAKAVEQLGNSKEEVIIGGIYSLERIAKDSSKDQWTIMEVLTAFVRKNSPISSKIQNLEENKERLKALEKLESVNIQVQAALTVIGRRDLGQDYTLDEDRERNIKRLDLSNSNLRNANLRNAILYGADIRDANLSRADLIGAILYGANLIRTNLSRANLSVANLSYADLGDANLRNAILGDADLSYADLGDANLRNADLRNADLRDANLRNARNLSNQQIKSACFWEQAIYTNTELNETGTKLIAADEKANQKKIEAIKQDKASDPKNPPDCNNIWKYR
jgi:uncharacterized protein YjbI with pentapeptide repeats